MKPRDLAYFRVRERAERERAARATHPAAQQAHLRLAELYASQRHALETLAGLERPVEPD